VYGGAAIALMGSVDLRLALPIVLWFGLYALLLWYFVPRMRERSRAMSEMRSTLSGRIVDAYTNILTVKLFARPARRGRLSCAIRRRAYGGIPQPARLITAFGITLTSVNATMIRVSTRVPIALWLWSSGKDRRTARSQ